MKTEILAKKVSDSASFGIWKFVLDRSKGLLGICTQHSCEGLPLQVRPSLEGLSDGLPGRQTKRKGKGKEEWEQLELFFDLPPPDLPLN